MEENIFWGSLALLLEVFCCQASRTAGDEGPPPLQSWQLLLARLIGLDMVPRQSTGESVLKCFAGCGFNL